jgi:hypothetical protein
VQRLELKLALIRYYGNQRAAARALQLSEKVLCHIISGKREPNRAELDCISRALACRIFELVKPSDADFHDNNQSQQGAGVS